MTNPTVDFYFEKSEKWFAEIEKLRTIVLDCGLTEELKWGCPCYTFRNNNVAIIHEFKNYCAIYFIKGALLEDVEGILVQQTENVQSGRQIRFADLQQISKLQSTIKAYLYEAIEIEKAGLKVELKKPSELILIAEFQNKLDIDAKLKTAFEALTPGRQRAYNLFFSEAKQAHTRLTRIDKYTKQILSGKGLHDCTCGLSKKMPQCDGSHKFK